MKKILTLFIIITVMLSTSFLTKPVSVYADTITVELGQLKVCKAIGPGVIKGDVFTFTVGTTNYSVPAGYCILAGQFPLNTQVTIKETIPAGYFVASITIEPSDRTVRQSTSLAEAVVKIGSGITEVFFKNATSTSTSTKTPEPPTTPQGYMQICKQADGTGVSGYFAFRFDSQSKSVPVGSCSNLIFNLTPGTLTVTEDARTGYQVAEIYTIPADRLISKDINARTATITILPSGGDASLQTVVVFVNRRVESNTPTSTPTNTLTNTPTNTSTATPTGTLPTNTPTNTPTFTPTGTLSTNTPTNTPTFTPTGTPPTNTPTNTPTFTPTGTLPTNTPTNTPTSCQPVVVTADFSTLALGQSVEGLGVVAPGLNIDAKNTAVKISPNVEPIAYFANDNGVRTINGFMTSDSGFTDLITRNAVQPHLYTFTFVPGTSISNFSLHMLDFGDLNPTNDTNHYASLTAYDAQSNVIAKQELSYTTLPESLPQSSDLYGNLQITGDASALPGQPGNWTWNVSGSGIVKVVLEFGVGYDPNLALDILSFTTECP